jgi:WD40 repeat protein
MAARAAIAAFLSVLLVACGGSPVAPVSSAPSASAPATQSGLTLIEFITQPVGKDNVEPLAFSPDSKRIAIGAADGFVAIFSLENPDNDPVVAKLHGGFISALAWSPAGDRILTGATDGSVRLTDTATLRNSKSFTAFPNSYPAVAWSADGRQFALSQGRNAVQVFDAASYDMLDSFDMTNATTRDLAWLPGGEIVASDDTGQVFFFNRGQAKAIRTFKPATPHKAVNSLRASPDGKMLLVGYDDGVAVLLDPATATQTGELVKGRQIGSTSWSPNGQLLAVSSVAFDLSIYNPQGGLVSRQEVGYDVNGSAWSPDGRYIAAGTDAHDFRIWRLQPPQTPSSAPSAATSSSFMGR